MVNSELLVRQTDFVAFWTDPSFQTLCKARALPSDYTVQTDMMVISLFSSRLHFPKMLNISFKT